MFPILILRTGKHETSFKNFVLVGNPSSFVLCFYSRIEGSFPSGPIDFSTMYMAFDNIFVAFGMVSAIREYKVNIVDVYSNE